MCARARWQNRALLMRVLLLHNRYRLPGGEERAVADLRALLVARGHDVHVIERSSDAAGRGAAARGLIAGGLDPDEVRRAVRRTRADVVHAHNVHPLFGWRALAAARAAGARTVLHLHNFRLFCAISIAYRDGAVCFRCQGRNTLPGLRLRCRGSVPEAAAYAAGLSLQQPTLLEHADRLVTVSRATADRLGRLGAPADRIQVLPNFVSAERFAADTRAHEGRYALVAGRLVEEKGFDTAITACRAAGVPLVVAGDGPDAERLKELAAGGDVRFTGRLSEEALTEARGEAAVVLAPSRWEEPCPYSVLDALAAGVPVLGSPLGGLPELLPSSSEDLTNDQAWTQAIERLWRDPDLRARTGRAGLELARRRFGEDLYYEGLMEIYG
jgi:glycosyltransferase involved in cell wall biosynthesis